MLSLAAEMQAMRAIRLASVELPSHSFFTPTEEFWRLIKQKHDALIRFFECGAGMGRVLDQAKERGLHMEGCDISYRPGQSDLVSRCDATRLTIFNPFLWPLVCRPSHDGWIDEVAKTARVRGANMLYAGLPSNYDRDIRHYRTVKLNVVPVGIEGESLYLIKLI